MFLQHIHSNLSFFYNITWCFILLFTQNSMLIVPVHIRFHNYEAITFSLENACLQFLKYTTAYLHKWCCIFLFCHGSSWESCQTSISQYIYDNLLKLQQFCSRILVWSTFQAKDSFVSTKTACFWHCMHVRSNHTVMQL